MFGRTLPHRRGGGSERASNLQANKSDRCCGWEQKSDVVYDMTDGCSLTPRKGEQSERLQDSLKSICRWGCRGDSGELSWVSWAKLRVARHFGCNSDFSRASHALSPKKESNGQSEYRSVERDWSRHNWWHRGQRSHGQITTKAILILLKFIDQQVIAVSCRSQFCSCKNTHFNSLQSQLKAHELPEEFQHRLSLSLPLTPCTVDGVMEGKLGIQYVLF